jgi:hypothetical protein
MWSAGTNNSEDPNSSIFRVEKSPTLNIYAVCSSEELVPICRNARRNIPKYSELPVKCPEARNQQQLE